MSHHHVLREKLFEIYNYISENLYLNRSDIEINGRQFNSTLLMSLLTGLSQGKELIIGEPGLGKTTSAEYVCALIYRIPLGTIWRAEISGHPEQTEEKIIGRPDLGKLNQGQEVVLWSYFTLLPTKIVDELNRLPETKQSMILDGVDRGKWEYLNDAIINPEFCFFATANYADQGTNTIVAPLIDRFDVLVESKHPGANLAYRVGTQVTDDMILRSHTLEGEFDRILSSKRSFEERIQKLEKLCDHFGQNISKDLGLHTLSRSERQEIRSCTNQVSFDL
ncbi:MAG: AAA family ATPase, partial [Deltaproteobacteria bacterium]